VADHHSSRLAELKGAAAHWKNQAEQSQLVVDEVARGVSSIMARQRDAQRADLQDALKSKAQALIVRLGAELNEELKERYSQFTEVWNALRYLVATSMYPYSACRAHRTR
jgi:hypothetical protein